MLKSIRNSLILSSLLYIVLGVVLLVIARGHIRWTARMIANAALCLALALGLMAGCGSLEDVDLGVSAAPENTGAGDASSLQLDWDAARAKHELDATVLTVDGENVELTRREFDLLRYLLENKERVISRESLLDHVWGFDFVGETNAVDVYIRFLRAKIDEHFGIKLIHTVRGVGYVIREEGQ